MGEEPKKKKQGKGWVEEYGKNKEKEKKGKWFEVKKKKIVISEDLAAFEEKQLQFLAVVEKHRCLYDDPTLQKAIYRSNACWLPLLAKHSDSQIFKEPLVVPLIVNIF